MVYKFRQLEYNDYHKEYLKLIESNNITFTQFDEYIKTVLNDNHIIIVIENNNKIIGTGTLLIERKLTHNFCKMGHIENILIHPEYRKKGLGELLVKKLLKIAKLNKCYRIDLTCVEELEKFYKKNNFEKKQIKMSILFEENF